MDTAWRMAVQPVLWFSFAHKTVRVCTVKSLGEEPNPGTLFSLSPPFKDTHSIRGTDLFGLLSISFFVAVGWFFPSFLLFFFFFFSVGGVLFAA